MLPANPINPTTILANCREPIKSIPLISAGPDTLPKSVKTRQKPRNSPRLSSGALSAPKVITIPVESPLATPAKIA